MNETIQNMLNHRTYREFTQDPVDPEIIQELIQVVQRTATSTGMQQSSIIRVTDPEQKKKMAVVGAQEYVARAPEVWVFVVDAYRNAHIYEEKTGNKASIGMDSFVAGFTDAALTAQNIMCALESYGLGGAFLGNVLNDPAEMRKILGLPDYVFPVLGMIFGKPNQSPQLKPRMDMRMRFFENEYKRFDGEYMTELADYDQEMTTYYDLREANRRVDCFSDQVVRGLDHQKEARSNILKYVKDAGFRLGDEGNHAE